MVQNFFEEYIFYKLNETYKKTYTMLFPYENHGCHRTVWLCTPLNCPGQFYERKPRKSFNIFESISRQIINVL